MLLCNRCKSLCEEGARRCPSCNSNKLRPVGDGDFVFLQRADLYMAQQVEAALLELGIPCQLEAHGRGQPTALYDSEVMPTDKDILVPYRDLTAARGVAGQVGAEVDKARAGDEPEEFEDMPPKKRLLVQALSAIGFIVLVMAVVFAADAAAGWLKGLLGLG